MTRVDHLGTVSVTTVLVFRACCCGTLCAIAAGGMSLIMCGAVNGVCVLARSGGAISGCVFFVTRLVCCAELCIGECVLLIAGPA